VMMLPDPLRRHYRHGAFHRGKSAADVNGDRRVEPVEVDLGNADPLRTRPGIVEYAIVPNQAMVCSIIAFTSASAATSVGTKRANSPRVRASCSPRSRRRPAITTLAPFSTNSAAVRAPMPLVPPVMIATFLSSDSMDQAPMGRHPNWCARSFEPIGRRVDYVPGN